MSKFLRYLILSLCLLSFSVYAEIVSDPALEESSRNIEEKQNQLYNLMNNSIAPAIREGREASEAMRQTMEKSLTGNSGVGAAINTPEEQSFRDWTPSAQDLQNMVSQGLQTGSMADQIKYYNEKFNVPRSVDLTPADENSVMGSYGEFSAISTNAALSVADKSFNNASAISKQLNYLYGLIDQQPTLKQSMDLNTAIALKIAALQAELMRLQAQQLKMQAVSQHETNSNRLEMMHFVKNID